MAGLSPAHLVIILVIALVVIGPGKLPEVGAAIGKSLREFQKASGGLSDQLLPGVLQPAKPAAEQPVPMQPMVPMAQQAPAQSFYAAQPGYPTQQYAVQPVPAAYPPTLQAQPAIPEYPLVPAFPVPVQTEIAPAVGAQPEPSVEPPSSTPSTH
jgi:TatA/E family protein of Tat protein translocase